MLTEEKKFSQAGYLNENYHYFHLKDTAGQERDYHYHDFDKLVLLLSGRVDYAVEDTLYSLKSWDVLLIKHHTIHKALIDIKEPYERIIIYLDRKFFDRALPDGGLMDCFDISERTGRHLHSPDEAQKEAIKAVLRAYEKAMSAADPYSQAMRDTLIMQLLIQINSMTALGPNLLEPKYDSKIQTALSYINEHLNQEMTVDTLAERVYLSKYHFMRLFKAQTGSTVHAYIRQKRLLYAARLIREGVSANKAAEESGFGDYSTFHRAFKDNFGVSPGELKVR